MKEFSTTCCKSEIIFIFHEKRKYIYIIQNHSDSISASLQMTIESYRGMTDDGFYTAHLVVKLSDYADNSGLFKEAHHHTLNAIQRIANEKTNCNSWYIVQYCIECMQLFAIYK